LLKLCEESKATRGSRSERTCAKESIMTDTTFIERDVVIPAATDASRTPFSWSAAIAGAFAATAVTFIVVALGSGIGLSFASPYGSGPSATSLTAAAAVWLVMAQAMGFATGGYLAGRLRSPAYDGVIGETAFRDAAQGFIVWALGAVAMAAVLLALGYFAASATARVAGGAAAAATARGEPASAATDYFVDLLFRPGPAPATNNAASATVGVAAAGAQSALNTETRAEATRVLVRSVAQGRLDDNDRAYLAQVVSARTGLPPDEAQRRVTEVEGKARAAAKEAADKTAKAGAYFSFWTFMSLLFGGAAATLAGMLGGQLRDAEGRLAPG
jgi:hypothetical protein